MDPIQCKIEWFRTIILVHQSALRARLRRMTVSPADLDDLCSEVLTRAYATPQWERITAGRAFLFSIARNLIIDMARRDKIVAFETIADLELLQAGPDCEAQLFARDELRLIEKIMEQMPVQARRVFLMRRVQEKSLAEIAEEMGLSVSTVEKHLAKAVLFVMQAQAKHEDNSVDGRRSGERRTGDGRGDCGTSARQAQS